MLHGGVILLASFAYLGILFAIAYYGDKRADAGRSIIANPYIYALSMAVYATSWTFYGSVGRAATGGNRPRGYEDDVASPDVMLHAAARVWTERYLAPRRIVDPLN